MITVDSGAVEVVGRSRMRETNEGAVGGAIQKTKGANERPTKLVFILDEYDMYFFCNISFIIEMLPTLLCLPLQMAIELP